MPPRSLRARLLLLFVGSVAVVAVLVVAVAVRQTSHDQRAASERTLRTQATAVTELLSKRQQNDLGTFGQGDLFIPRPAARHVGDEAALRPLPAAASRNDADRSQGAAGELREADQLGSPRERRGRRRRSTCSFPAAPDLPRRRRAVPTQVRAELGHHRRRRPRAPERRARRPRRCRSRAACSRPSPSS